MSQLGVTEIVLIVIVVLIITVLFKVIPYWKILSKAGYPPALSFLMLLPLVDVVVLYFLAFAPWPSLTDVRKEEGPKA